MAASDYIYPSNVDLSQVAQDKIPRLTADRLAFQIIPMETVDAALVEWEQLANYTGLQQPRGLNGVPQRVKQLGSKLWQMEPGYYGEFSLIDERAITTRRPLGTFTGAMDLTTLVMEKQDYLLERRLNRIEQIIWTCLSSGTISVANGQGVVLYSETYTFQTFSAIVGWATKATATPLSDLRAARLLARGHSVSFGRNALLIMNGTTYNNMIGNTNPADLGGKRIEGGNTYNTLADYNTVLMADDLPAVMVYDETYYDDAGAVQLYIPNNIAILIGRRPAGQRIGSYKMTRNAQNAGAAPGPYMAVTDSLTAGIYPREVAVHDGHNGGLAIPFANAVVILSV